MYKVEFHLRQHTPIIHFQWHEKDATLRPTELKAKLDKWIIASMTGCYGNEEARKKACEDFTRLVNGAQEKTLWKWLKGAKNADKTHPALNFSVRVIPFDSSDYSSILETKVVEREEEVFNKHLNKKVKEKVKVVVNKDFPSYFGNQLKVEEFETGAKRIKRLTFHKGVQLIITSPYYDLITKIKEVFPEFILKTNFGTRQSKGFGSFFIERGTEGFPENHKDWFEGKFDWKFDLKVVGNTPQRQVEDLFKKIDLFYKTLRSGISPHDKQLYFKSMMWKYTKSLNPPRQWDKKTIKQNWFSTIENDQKTTHSVYNTDEWPLHYEKGNKSIVRKGQVKIETHLLWRDLLGLSSIQSWKKPYNKDLAKTVVRKVDGKPAFTRLQSPIYFKPIRSGNNTFRVFFEVPEYLKTVFRGGKTVDSPAEILGEFVDFSANGKSNFSLPFPENFDFDGFFNCAFQTNPADWVKDGTYIKRVGGNEFKEPHGRFRKERINGRFNIVQNSDYNCLESIYTQLAVQLKLRKNAKA